MSKVPTVSVAVVAALLLGGCAAAVVPLIAAEVAGVGYAGLKLVQTTTGGSMEISIDVSKVTSEQKALVKNLKSIAVWPERRGASVSLAEALSEGGQFAVISPSRVASALKNLSLSDELKLMTTTEARDTFSKVCGATNADAVVFTKMTATNTTMNTWSLERANITMEYLTSIYARSTNNTIVTIPVTLKVLVGEKRPPSDEEISNLANAELAKKIIALAADQPETENRAAGSLREGAKQDGLRETESSPSASSGDFLSGMKNSLKGLFGTQ